MFMFLAASSTSINPHEEREDYMLPPRICVPMEMAASAHCVEGCDIRGGWMKWKLNEQGEGRGKSCKEWRLRHVVVSGFRLNLPPFSL